MEEKQEECQEAMESHQTLSEGERERRMGEVQK